MHNTREGEWFGAVTRSVNDNVDDDNEEEWNYRD